MPYNPELHHRRSIRLQNYNYSQNGAYFVTTVVYQRECLLSTVIHGEVELSPVGKVIETTWYQLPERFSFLHLEQSCIMPNHFHGILIFSGDTDTKQTLGQVLRAFKSLSGIAGNQVIGQKNRPFWQRNYYEHVIRNEAEFDRIGNYIAENPLRWADDEENPAHQL